MGGLVTASSYVSYAAYVSNGSTVLLCPRCKEPVIKFHCDVKECGWWQCEECKIKVNAKGRTSPVVEWS